MAITIEAMAKTKVNRASIKTESSPCIGRLGALLGDPQGQAGATVTSGLPRAVAIAMTRPQDRLDRDQQVWKGLRADPLAIAEGGLPAVATLRGIAVNQYLPSFHIDDPGLSRMPAAA